MNLPEHKYGLTIEHNMHKNYYELVSSWIEDSKDQYVWVDEDKIKAIELDEVWTIQWYPDSPVGFYAVASYSLERLLEIVGQHEEEYIRSTKT